MYNRLRNAPKSKNGKAIQYGEHLCIEINTTEHFQVLPLKTITFSTDSEI